MKKKVDVYSENLKDRFHHEKFMFTGDLLNNFFLLIR